MDTDVGVVWDFFKHLFPEFTVNHALVYKLLWRLEPKSGEDIIRETGISKATTYRILHDLVLSSLVVKTSFKPVGYYAANPLKSYNLNAKRLAVKLETGKGKLENLIQNSTGLSGELYLVKRDGGQQRLIAKENRQAILDGGRLRELRKAIDQQLLEADKATQITIYR